MTEGFFVPSDQQRAGLMEGTIEPSSLFVQTATNFRFELTPSNYLSVNAYAEINFPDTL